MTCPLLLSVLLSTSLSAAVAEPACEVSGRTLTVDEILGCSSRDLRARFDADTKAWTAEQLRRYIACDRTPQSPLDDLPKLRAEAWEVAYCSVWQTTFGTLQDAAVTDGIAEALGIRLTDYYDLGVLGDARRRYNEYCLALDEAREAGRANSPELRGELVAKYRCTLRDDAWARYAVEVLSRPQPRSLRRQFLTASGLAEARVKRMLVGPLLEEALATGAYHKRALARLAAETGRYLVLEVADWGAPPDALDAFVRRAIGPDGAWLAEALPSLVATLSAFGRVRVGLQDVFGSALEGLGFELGSPQPAHSAPHAWRWAARPPGYAAPRAEPDPVSLRVAAMDVARARWGATLTVRLPNWRQEWAPDLRADKRGGISGCSARECVPEVELDPFEKKKVPAELFEQWEQGLPAYQLLVAQLAAAVAGRSTAEASIVRQAIAAEANNAPAVWRPHYATLAEKLKPLPAAK